jgi:hypothetical protein
MPSKTPQQKRLMQACSHPSGRKWAKTNKVQCPSQKVAQEFSRADKKARRPK